MLSGGYQYGLRVCHFTFCLCHLASSRPLPSRLCSPPLSWCEPPGEQPQTGDQPRANSPTHSDNQR